MGGLEPLQGILPVINRFGVNWQMTDFYKFELKPIPITV